MTLSEKRSIAGRKGGIARARKYPAAQLSEWAKLGGHPKAKCLKDITAKATVKNEKEVIKLSNLNQLKELFRLAKLDLKGGEVKTK